MKSAKELEVMTRRLKSQLSRSAVPRAERKRLLARLKEATDVTRRNAAIWALVDALEESERA